MKNKVVVIGAGLCGSMLALRLAQRGYEVSLREKRNDMRRVEYEGGRSINLALSDRGLKALRLVGLEEEARKLCTPMLGRRIHFRNGTQRFSRYSGRQEDYINSISRGDLNILLLNAAEATGKVTTHFNSPCVGVNIEEGTAQFKSSFGESNEKGEVIIGTDGAGSAVRRSYMGRTTDLLFNYSQHFLRTGYKEVTIPPGPNGSYRIENDALHIWPRESFMIIALPNLDGSFTVTLFWPYKGENGFDQMDTWPEVKAFFQKEFADLLPHLPELEEEYFTNPTGSLGTIKCWPWQVDGRFLILGDAAHAIVPFYGQGMNASFEDVTILDEFMDKYNNNWQKILPAYSEFRKPDADAIADLALDNFYEMQDHVAEADFIKKRDIEHKLEQEFPEYYSKYSLVTFQENLRYHEAMNLGRKQDELLLSLARSGELETLDLEEILLKTQSLR